MVEHSIESLMYKDLRSKLISDILVDFYDIRISWNSYIKLYMSIDCLPFFFICVHHLDSLVYVTLTFFFLSVTLIFIFCLLPWSSFFVCYLDLHFCLLLWPSFFCLLSWPSFFVCYLNLDLHFLSVTLTFIFSCEYSTLTFNLLMCVLPWPSFFLCMHFFYLHFFPVSIVP